MQITQHREPLNKGKLVGQKRQLKPRDIWAIRIQLQNAHNVRDLAMLNLAIDSRLLHCRPTAKRVSMAAPAEQQSLPEATLTVRHWPTFT
jgi:hypothetical protein